MLTEETRRRDFPSLAGMAYLNTAAEGIPPLAVREALLNYFADKQRGMDGRERHAAEWEAARGLIAELFGLSAQEVSLCSCSSEAFNLAAGALRLREGDEVVINDLDFPAGTTPWLQPSCPATVRVWRSREGALRFEDLMPLLGGRTRLVTTSLVSFYNGFRIDLPRLVEIVHQHSAALLAVDVTQAIGRIPMRLEGVDLIVSSTHKWILASHGGGMVGVPARVADQWRVPAGGWFHLQDAFGERRFERATSRPGAIGFSVGMPNYPAVYAIRAALDYLRSIGVDAIDAAARPIVDACREELSRLPVEMLTPNSADQVAGILAFKHPRADQIAARLRAADIHIMCHASRLRIAIHGYNTYSDIERLFRALTAAIQ